MKLFSVDVETDGLYGDIWAIGAVVWEDGQVIAHFAGQVDTSDLTDAWVKSNICPFTHLPIFNSRLELRNSFWNFWIQHKTGAIAIADFGSPVESFLFRKCVEDNLPERMWLAPFPLHEVATALLMKGFDPDIDRIQFSGLEGLTKHNPVDDALASLHCFLKLI